MKQYVIITLLISIFCPEAIFAHSNQIPDKSSKCQKVNVRKISDLRSRQDVMISAKQNDLFKIPSDKIGMEQAVSNIAREYQMPEGTTFDLESTTNSRLDENIVYQRFQQYYEGIEVVGGGYTLIVNKNEKSPNSSRIIPKFINHKAFDKSKIKSNAVVQARTKSNKAKSELKIVQDLLGDCDSRLVYVSHFFDGGAKVAYIDAETGKLLKEESAVENKNAPTEDYGSRDMKDIDEGGMTVLKSTTNRNINTYDFTGQLYFLTSFANTQYIPSMPSTNTMWTTEAAPSVFQAHWVTSEVADIYENALGINFLNINVGSYGVATNGNDYDGAHTYQSATLQDAEVHLGTFEQSSTYAEVDVLGHELGHIVLHDYFVTNGIGNKTVAEGLSDMLGVYVEYLYDNNGSVDWKVGNSIASNYPARDLESPQWACFDEVIDFEEEHDRSVPMGHWFYLISEGNANATCNSFNGLTIDVAIGVVMDALQMLSGSIDYKDVRLATVTAAEAAFGAGSTEVAIINQAWNEICVPEVISANEIINTDGTYGNITVETGNTLTIQDAVISMLPDAVITVEDGATLIIDKSTITACDERWGHIYCDLGTIEVKNTSIIEKGKFGIYSFEGCNIMASTNSTFRDLEAGITIRNENAPIIQGLSIIIDEVTFSGLEGSPFPIAGQGIVTGSSEIQITRSIFTDLDVGLILNGQIASSKVDVILNDFILNRTDIALYNSKAETKIVDNNTFESVLHSIYSYGTDNVEILQNVFDNHEVGIQSIDSKISVARTNEFLSCEIGIDAMSSMMGVSEIEILLDNYFFECTRAVNISGIDNFNGANINGNLFESNTLGVSAEGSNHFRIEDNQFILTRNPNLIKSTGDAENSVYCNEMISPSTGIYFMHLNTNTTFENNITSQASNFDVVHNGHIRDNIGNQSAPALNRFSNIPTNIRRIFPNELGYSFTGVGPFNYWLPSEPIQSTDPSGIPQNWKFDSSNEENNICMAPPNNIVFTFQELLDIMEDYCDLLAQLEQDPTNWTLIQQVKHASILAKRAIYYAFKDQFTWEELEVILSNSCDFFGMANLFFVYISQDKCDDAILVLDELENMVSTSTATTSEALINNTRITSFVTTMRIGLKHYCTKLEPDPDDRDVFPITRDIFTSSEIATLLTEANSDLPEAAYARTLYYIATGTLLPLSDPMVVSNTRNSYEEDKFDEEDLMVYPNPVASTLSISLPEYQRGSHKLELTDMFGNVGIMQSVSESTRNIEIDIRDFPNGIYFISLYDRQKNITAQKKVIIHH